MVKRLIICLHPQDILKACLIIRNSKKKSILLVIKDKNFDNSKLLEKIKIQYLEIESLMFNLKILGFLKELLSLKKKVYLVNQQIQQFIINNNLVSINSIWVSDHSRFSISTKIFCDLMKKNNSKIYSYGTEVIRDKYDNLFLIEPLFYIVHKLIYKNYIFYIHCFKNIQSQFIFNKNYFNGRAQLYIKENLIIQKSHLFNDSIIYRSVKLEFFKEKKVKQDDLLIIDRFSSIQKLNSYLNIDEFNFQYFSLIQKILKQTKLNIFIKSHPRDTSNSNFLNYFDDNLRVSKIRTSLTLEELYFNHSVPKYSLAIDSTGLKTMSIFGSKSLCIINLFNFSQKYKNRVFNFMNVGFGIRFPNDSGDFFKYLIHD